MNRNTLAYCALYAVYVAALHAIDGPWRRWKEERPGKAVDGWTATHIVWGMIGRRMGVSEHDVLILSTLNEAVEAGVRTFRPDLLWGSPESAANVLTDMVATYAGYKLEEVLE